MSYLVIYPQHLHIQKREGNHCLGSLSCDVLQYGLWLELSQTEVELKYLEDDQVRFYRIRVKQMESIPAKHMARFERCLNDYVFDLEGMRPDFQPQNGIPTWHIHFSEICFVLYEDRFEISMAKDARTWPVRS